MWWTLFYIYICVYIHLTWIYICDKPWQSYLVYKYTHRIYMYMNDRPYGILFYIHVFNRCMLIHVWQTLKNQFLHINMYVYIQMWYIYAYIHVWDRLWRICLYIYTYIWYIYIYTWWLWRICIIYIYIYCIHVYIFDRFLWICFYVSIYIWYINVYMYDRFWRIYFYVYICRHLSHMCLHLIEPDESELCVTIKSCSGLQWISVCCSVLQCVAVWVAVCCSVIDSDESTLSNVSPSKNKHSGFVGDWILATTIQVCCSVFAVSCSELQCVADNCSELH